MKLYWYLLRALKAQANANDDRLKWIRDAHNIKKENDEQQHTDRMEDYLEVIYELIQQKGYATIWEDRVLVYPLSPV